MNRILRDRTDAWPAVLLVVGLVSYSVLAWFVFGNDLQRIVMAGSLLLFAANRARAAFIAWHIGAQSVAIAEAFFAVVLTSTAVAPLGVIFDVIDAGANGSATRLIRVGVPMLAAAGLLVTWTHRRWRDRTAHEAKRIIDERDIG